MGTRILRVVVAVSVALSAAWWVAACSQSPQAKAPEIATHVISAGTRLNVKLLTTVSSAASRINEPLRAELAEAVRVDGKEVLPAGTLLFGAVDRVEASGKVRGLGSVSFHFDQLRTDLEPYAVELTYSRTAEPTKGRDAATVAVPAAGGALLGAAVGGKKGALIGGLIGAGAGAGAVMATSGDEVIVAAGTILHLTLPQDLVVRLAKS